jgi:hypothetical protein
VASPLSVAPPNVTVVAVKPRGNPLAVGRVGALGTFDEADQAEVTVRLHEESGRPATARLEFGRPISAAWLTDLLEAADGAALPVEGGRAVLVDMPAFGTVTLVVRTSSRASAAYRDAVEPVQPVYARYWLHGKGPAPAGNMPVAVHFAPTRVALPQAGDTATLTLTVGCGVEPATGTVELDVPDGIVVSSADDLRYELAPGGYAAWHLTVRAAPGTAAGRYFAAARITDEFGRVIEDTAMVAVGERKWPDPELPPEQTIEALQDDYVAGAAELEVAVLTPELRLVPGGEGVIEVKVTNGLASGLHGEAQLVSPFGTWPLLGPWTQGFAAAPGDSATLRFTVRAPATERPGSRWWALVKIMYFGRVRYTEAVPVSIEPG